MKESIDAIMNLRELLRKRSIELEELIMELEEQTCGITPEEEETEEAQELIHKTSLAYQELRLNDRMREDIQRNLCDWCKLNPNQRLCDFC